MKMLMIIVGEAKREELEIFLNHSGVQGYTEVANAAGMGVTGPRLGSSAFPKTSALVFTVLDEAVLGRVQKGVDQFCATCGEELRMIAWDAEVLR